LVGEWPENVRIDSRFTRASDNAIWFVRSARDLDSVAVLLSANFRKGLTAWICYPKQSGRYKVDFNLNTVRATCVEVGLIDCKICSIDKDWSGMKIVRKKR